MDLSSITKVLLKIAGIYFLVLVVALFPELFAGNLSSRSGAGALFSIGLWGAIGLALLLFPGVITDHVIRIRGSTAGEQEVPVDLVRSGVRLLGCYFALSALYGLLYKVALVWIFNQGVATFVFNSNEKASLLSTAVEFTAGLLLWIFGDPMVHVGPRLKRLFAKPAPAEST